MQHYGFVPKKGTVTRIIKKYLKEVIELQVRHEDGTLHMYLINAETGKIHGKEPSREELTLITQFRRTIKQRLWPKGPKGRRGTVYVTDPNAYQTERVREAYKAYLLRTKPIRYYTERGIRNHEAWWQKED